MQYLMEADPELVEVIRKEEDRQKHKLELIASENYTSQAVLEAAGTVLTNKYAEGYPGKRYYGGCEYVDIAEDLARNRAKELFGADHVNVQPHSGSNANMSVYMTVLQPGDTIMGMDLAHGGHLTHGASVSFSGKIYRSVSYGVSKESETLDYDEIAETARRERPKLIIAGASAYPRTIDFERFAAIATEVGAYFMTDMAHIAGLVAAGVHPSPVPYSDFVTTTTHKTLRGPRGGMVLIGRDKENDMGIVAPKSGRTRRFSELLDSTVMPGVQGGPLMHIIAAKAVAFKQALQSDFTTYQKQVVKNASVLAERLSDGGLRLVSGGTDNHLMLLDLTALGISGRDAEHMLDAAGITVNKNGIPYDTRSPLVTSGIRIGTPALTTRGMAEDEMAVVAAFILKALKSGSDEQALKKIAGEVREFCAAYPLFSS
ncbi:serine hydroxymethyltransferase [Spirochaeta dissipatitropha]